MRTGYIPVSYLVQQLVSYPGFILLPYCLQTGLVAETIKARMAGVLVVSLQYPLGYPSMKGIGFDGGGATHVTKHE